jgi:uncharacterized protein YjdB
LTVTYDPALYEFIKAEGANSNIMVMSPEGNTGVVPGTVRIIAVNQGGVTGNTPVLKLTFNATGAAGNSGNIGVTKAQLGVGSDGSVIDPAMSSLSVGIVAIPVAKVTLDKDTLAMTAAGETKTLTATVDPDNATNRNVTWTSSNETVATVVDGVVTAVANGTATITGTTVDGGKTATCEVTVNIPVPVTGVTLNKTILKFTAAGQNETLTATVDPDTASNKNVTWSSGNTDIATVDANGKVTAVGNGMTKIMVKTEEGSFVSTCAVYVSITVPVTGVTLNTESLKLTAKGQTAALTATVNPETATNKDVSWTSSNDAAATVVDGVVTAVGSGTAVITVKTVDGGMTATCTVTVVIGDLNNNGNIDIGDLAIAAYYYGSKSGDANWADARIADINGDGAVDILDLATIARIIVQ